jgi:CO/xanthine dehydrogenase Mo-binding subunit
VPEQDRQNHSKTSCLAARCSWRKPGRAGLDFIENYTTARAAWRGGAKLAYALAIDPVELRIRNHAARDEQHDPHQLVGSS